MYDIIIIGGGPAACSAGVYSARKKLKTLLLAKELGGQSAVSPEVQNWLGEPSITGEKLANKFVSHLRSYEGENLEIIKNNVASVEKSSNNFTVTDEEGKKYEAKTILLATGGSRRRLAVKGADDFEHKGLTYCASCDGPLFSGQNVVVIGGGNAGFGTASQLLAYCSKVTLLEAGEQFRAEAVTIEKLKQNPRFEAIKNIELLEIKGSLPAGGFVSAISYRDKTTNEIKELPVTGIFVEIGFAPNTQMIKNLINLNPVGYAMVDHQTQRTSQEGIWAVGDCSDVRYHQNGIAAGDAIKAIENIYEYLN